MSEADKAKKEVIMHWKNNKISKPIINITSKSSHQEIIVIALHKEGKERVQGALGCDMALSAV